MEIVVRGKNIKVAPAVQATTREKLAKVTRFGLDVTRVEVDFSEIRNARVHDNQMCEVTAHLKGHFVKAHAASTDQIAALDLVIDKVEHQVTRLKERQVDRKHRPRRKRLAPPPPLEDWEESTPASAGGIENGAGHAEIIRTKQFTAKPMSVEEAALQMDLLGHDFYLFKDAQTGHATVLYRRRDGHLGLIEAVG
ncbi:MAG: ribosome hibernation-promoting factor, HPF/YfiA family [Acidimicrobiia bacterium]